LEALAQKPATSAQPPTPEFVHAGETLFVQECSRCHVFGPSVTPDLRQIAAAMPLSAFKDVVLRGAAAPTGMERFDDLLDTQGAEQIYAYLIDEAGKAYTEQQAHQR
jgi:quinohemoprotein ethanol dehydrogenase